MAEEVMAEEVMSEEMMSEEVMKEKVMAENKMAEEMPADERKAVYGSAGIDPDVFAFGEKISGELKSRFERIDEVAEYNQIKVIKAFHDCKVSEACLYGSTGYGYSDIGRDTLEEVYARTFHTEAALVRPAIACGTHALAIALFGNLRPGDELLSISGKPYDTLEEVIGIRPSRGSLSEYGITYRQVDLKKSGGFDLDAVRAAISPSTKLVAIQRSKGYETRRTLSVSEIGEAVAAVKSVREDLPVMVDNCYGEFVETVEPSDVGADMIVGSLIKNPGGGLAPIGGYICGTKKCIQNAASRMTCPGLGSEIGASLTLNPSFYQGFFLAPTVTASALKAAIFAANLFERLKFPVIPDGRESRHDIIQAVTLMSPEAVSAFCRGIQSAAPVDAHVTPEPWDMPGYDDPVIMAAGAFVSGSSIELSADGPLRPPYNVYFQGGLTWPSARYGVLMAVQSLKSAGLLTGEHSLPEDL